MIFENMHSHLCAIPSKPNGIDNTSLSTMSDELVLKIRMLIKLISILVAQNFTWKLWQRKNMKLNQTHWQKYVNTLLMYLYCSIYHISDCILFILYTMMLKTIKSCLLYKKCVFSLRQFLCFRWLRPMHYHHRNQSL